MRLDFLRCRLFSVWRFAAVAGLGLLPVAGGGQSLKTIYTFTDFLGGASVSGLVQASDGNFYGTSQGGANSYGSVFRLAADGTFTDLYDFTGGTDGTNPTELREGPDGNLYGVSVLINQDGQGVFFRITPTGGFTGLHTFDPGTEGVSPSAIALGSDGAFYLTMSNDSGGNCAFFRLMRVTTAGATSQVAESSCQGANFATSGVVEGTDLRYWGESTVMAYAANSAGYTDIADAPGSSDGFFAIPMVEATNGDFYGFTGYSFSNGKYSTGQLFQLAGTGALTVNAKVLGYPSGLFEGGDGNLYGADNDGTNGDGELWMATPGGTPQVLYSFANGADGEFPNAPLEGADGNFYGTTRGNYSSHDAGTIWKLTPAASVAAPVSVTLSPATVAAGAKATLNFSVRNGHSKTLETCYLFSNSASGTATALGALAGSLSGGVFSGTASVTAGAAGTYVYAVTCGGQESGYSTLTVTNALKATATTVAATPNPVYQSQNVTVSATVKETSGSAVPTGPVEFYANGQALLQATLNSQGVASFTAPTASYAAGTYELTAKYLGDSSNAASTSAATGLVLKAVAATKTALSVSPTTVTPPGSVKLTATVTSSSGTPTGSVAFTVGSVTLTTVSVNGSGVASFTASSSGVASGTYPVVAKYLGATAYGASSSGAVDVDVK